MEYIYASLMLHSAGKEINEENLRKVLEAAGIQVDEVRLKAVVAALKEINIDEVIKSATAMPVAPVGVPAAAAQPLLRRRKRKRRKKRRRRRRKKRVLARNSWQQVWRVSSDSNPLQHVMVLCSTVPRPYHFFQATLPRYAYHHSLSALLSC